eukprot:TRINITY_DN22714_c0_g1_i1.p1 TRINITY_DN22714_c0_g1~~TRINITY_DN22714_c0_g1_i1.p1  ORF type:complete len:772 (-),score=152.36 TRINITY_DN22714_c0_g1_i1:285-2600(-)
MPKPVYSTADELAAAQSALSDKIDATKKQILTEVGAAQNKIKAEIAKLGEQVANNTKAIEKGLERCGNDSKAYSDAKSDETINQVKGMLKKFEDKTKEGTAKIDSLEVEFTAKFKQLMADELGALCGRLDKEFAQCRADFAQADEAKGAQLTNEIGGRCDQVQQNLDDYKVEGARLLEEKAGGVQKNLDDYAAAQARSEEQREERTQRSESEIWMKLDRLDELVKELNEQEQNDMRETRQYCDDQIEEYGGIADGRLDSLEKESNRMASAVCEVENLATRRVDWVIKNATKFLRPNSASKACLHTSWFSPKFDIGGAHGLQLELQLFRAVDHDAPDSAAGDIAIFLWACKGMNLCYRLHCGSKSQALEKVFNGRVPYGTKRFCWLKDQINRENDTLRVGVEILESIREVEHHVKAPPVPEITAEMSVIDREAAEEASKKNVDCSLLFRRHVNNRLQEQVKTQVEAMRSRMIRRVEWRVEQANMLRKCFPPGESMCSASFAAAGVDGMQLIFYPNGYEGATDGFCSLYLYCPAGTTVRCNLFVGKQQRDAHHTYEAAGAFGRSNFCRFEVGVDQNTNTINLALEVLEAHQDVAARVSHIAVAPGDRRSQSEIEGSPSGPINSTVKLQRCAGRTTGGASKDSDPLADRRVLPSLWTAKSLAEGPTLNYSTFDELKDEKPKRNRSMGGSFAPSSPTSLGGTRYNTQDTFSIEPPHEALQTPLPKLTKSRSAADWGRTSSEWTVASEGDAPRGGRGGRRGRGLAASASPMASPTI